MSVPCVLVNMLQSSLLSFTLVLVSRHRSGCCFFCVSLFLSLMSYLYLYPLPTHDGYVVSVSISPSRLSYLSRLTVREPVCRAREALNTIFQGPRGRVSCTTLRRDQLSKRFESISMNKKLRSRLVKQATHEQRVPSRVGAHFHTINSVFLFYAAIHDPLCESGRPIQYSISCSRR